jgi:hypothetical protein
VLRCVFKSLQVFARDQGELTRIVKKGGVPLVAKTSYRVQGISIPDEELFEASRARAEQLGMSFSAYVCHLIRRDLANPSDFRLMTPAGETYRLSRTAHPSLNEPAVVAAAREKAKVNLSYQETAMLLEAAAQSAGVADPPMPIAPIVVPTSAIPRQPLPASPGTSYGKRRPNAGQQTPAQPKGNS